jgi:hypothetical protein
VIGSPHYLTASGSLAFRWTPIRISHFAASAHVGPDDMMIVDRTSGSQSFGQGVRYGGTLTLNTPVVSGFVDYYRSSIVFMDGPAVGYNEITGVMVGLSLAN